MGGNESGVFNWQIFIVLLFDDDMGVLLLSYLCGYSNSS